MTTFMKGFFGGRKPEQPYHTRETIQAAADELRRNDLDLGDMLVGALMAANLAEPLDDTRDMDEAEKQRMRETY